VRGVNHCRLAVHRPQGGDTLVVLSVIDNLTKGPRPSVQKPEPPVRLPETLGLEGIARYPDGQ